MTFPTCIHPVELRGFQQTIGSGFSYVINHRRVRGVILAENRADLDALLAEILPGEEIDPTLYYSLGLFRAEIETPDAVHPDILAIRQSMAQWWRNRRWLYRMDGFMQWQTKGTLRGTGFQPVIQHYADEKGQPTMGQEIKTETPNNVWDAALLHGKSYMEKHGNTAPHEIVSTLTIEFPTEEYEVLWLAGYNAWRVLQNGSQPLTEDEKRDLLRNR